jgi:protein tyrosine/serine phosphatase
MRAKWIACSLAVLLLPFAVLGSYIVAIQSNRNFDTVVAQQVYRSAQPTAADLRKYAAEHHLGSIINLRGAEKGSAWYDDEIATASALGLKHYDFRMSASQALTQPEAAELVALLEHAEKPVLVHCNWGADRTGLASALYLAAIAKQGEAAAEAQLSLRFGHFSVPLLSQGYAMDETFEALEPWLGFLGS